MTRIVRFLGVESSGDDSALLEETIRNEWKNEAYFLSVGTEETFREALHRERWDIVFCLPSFEARKTLEILRGIGLDVPVIVISDVPGEDVAVETIKLGAEDYLLKGSLTRLLPAVTRALEQAERRERERKSEEIKRLILENSLDLVCTVTEQGKILEINPTATGLLGYVPSELIGLPFGKLIHHEDRAFILDVFEEVLRGRHAREVECRLLHRTGQAVNFTWSAIFSKADGVVVGVGRDITERKQKEEELQRERTLLRSLLDSTSDLIFFKDKDYVFLGCNRPFENYIGISESRLIGMTDFDFESPERARHFHEQDREVLTSGRPWRTEDESVDAAGMLRTFDVIRTPFHGPDGELLGLLGICRDITELKKIEHQLREERDYLNTVLDSLPGIFYHYDHDLKFLRWNKNHESVTGYSAEELAPMHPLNFFGEEDREKVAGRIAEIFEKGESLVEADFLLKDGRQIPYLFTGKCIEHSGRKSFVGVGLDIEQRKQLESALRRQTAILEAQVESSLDGILVVDSQGRKLIQNQRLSELWKTPASVFGDRDNAPQLEFAAQRTKKPAEFLAKSEWFQEHPREICRDEIELLDGTVLDRYSAPVLDKEGRYYGRTWIHRDITEQRRAEQEKLVLEARLQHNQKLEALGTLAGGIAHDFNNILATIVLNQELAMMNLNDPEELRRPLEDIGLAGGHAKKLVQQILTFSRQREADRRRQSLQAIIEETLDLVRRSLSKKIEIDSYFSPDTPEVLADSTQLHQVVMNLCTNAAHAMGESSGRLTVRLVPHVLDSSTFELRPGNYAKLTIADTGHGMDPAVQKRIFEPFFTTKSPNEGTGLGLAVVYGIVKEHQGDIAVHSEPGKGTTFELLFPEAPLSASPVRTENADILPGHQESILLVDDEKSLARVLGIMLTRLGYRVETFDDPRAALERLRAEPSSFDLLLTDRNMPFMSGPELVAQAHACRPDLTALVMSGLNNPTGEEQTAASRAYDHLTKPVTMAELSRAVRQALDRS